MCLIEGGPFYYYTTRNHELPFKVSKLYGIWHTAIVIIHIKYYLILIILNAIRSEINGDSEGGDIIFRLGDYDCLMMNIMGVRLGASHFLKVRHITVSFINFYILSGLSPKLLICPLQPIPSLSSLSL